MKEVRYFYVPEASSSNMLPDEEAQHAVRVLRMTEGDEMVLMDGAGVFFRAHVTLVDKRHCQYAIDEVVPQERPWKGHLHLAMAPTKNMDRTEWTCEKATEIGFDELTFLRCKFSERTTIKTERIDKILISATKQSRKAWKPRLNEMMDFRAVIEAVLKNDSESFAKQPVHKFICHCYDEPDLLPKRHLRDCIVAGEDALVLVGPEGDFSIDEVRMAEAAGFLPVTLGQSRLRTETAALVAVHIMNLFN